MEHRVADSAGLPDRGQRSQGLVVETPLRDRIRRSSYVGERRHTRGELVLLALDLVHRALVGVCRALGEDVGEDSSVGLERGRMITACCPFRCRLALHGS